MLSELSWAYHNYFNQNILIFNSKVEFYQQVSFEILDTDTSLKTEVKVHVGDIVDVTGNSDDDGGNNEQDHDQWFAKIIAIIVHKDNNNNNCIFLVFDWFSYHNFNTFLQCHCYKLQKGTENWRIIHSITIIAEQPKWHFIHDCKGSIDCEADNHDVNNRFFYRNDYLYTAV
jgi:hypothetical protein